MRTESAIEIFQVSRKTHCDISVDDAMITGVLRKKVSWFKHLKEFFKYLTTKIVKKLKIYFKKF